MSLVRKKKYLIRVISVIPTSVLILNTEESDNVPVLTDATGRVDRDLAFTFAKNTSVLNSCSVTFKNQHYVYGGYVYDGYERQISRIDGCRLRRIGDLPFDHYKGACTAVNDNLIYLCFQDGSDSSGDKKKCRYTTNPEG